MNKLSARNQIKRRIVDVSRGAATSRVRLEVGGGIIIMTSIANEAVVERRLKAGPEAWAMIKAPDPMVCV